MKRVQKIEDKLSASAAYRYIIGALLAIVALFKKGIKAFLKHSIEILTAAAFVGVIIATNLFDSGIVSFRMVVLLMLILAVLVCTLVKIKIFKE